MKKFQVRRTGMSGKSCWWYPISSGQIIYGLITFLVISDLCYLPLPHGFGVGVEARLRQQKRPITGRTREEYNRYDYHRGTGSRGGRHDYRNHRGGDRGGRWGRRRNDNETKDSEMIPATEVFILEEQVTSMMMGGSGANSEMMTGEGANSDMEMGMTKQEGEGMAGSASSPAANVTMGDEGTALETFGIIRGFLPGLTLGGGGGKGKGGGGLFGGGGGGGGGKGLFGGNSGLLGGKSNSDAKEGGGGKVIFPEYPGGNAGGGENGGEGGYGVGGGNVGSSQSNGGWSSGSPQIKEGGKGSGGGLFGGGGGGLFRNPFGGGGGGGKGRSPFRLLSKLNSDQPCAAGLANLPILNKIPFLPKNRRFPSFIPSGVNTCDKTCDAGPGCSEWRRVPPTQKEKEEMGDSSCTYNWRDSLTRFPFLLFRCHCKKDKCPKKTVRLSGLLRARCENVSEKKSRCKCPYGQQSYKCVLSFLPVAIPLIGRTKPYYCTCCSEGGMGEPLGEPLGGYGGATTTELVPASSVQVVSGGYSGAGGYEGGGGGGKADGKASASENVPKEVAQGRPLGFESIYAHLRRRF